MPQPFSSTPASPGTDGWRAVESAWTPEQMAVRLANAPGLIWLDSSLASSGARSILTTTPQRLLRGHLDQDWTTVEQLLQEGSAAGWSGGLFGWVGYDGRFVLGVYPHALLYDHDQSQWFDCGGLFDQISGQTPPLKPAPALNFQPCLSRDAFIDLVRRAQAYIAAGDIYQVNLAHSWRADWPSDQAFLPLYLRLRTVSPAPYAACMDLDGIRILSASPELFLHLRGNQATTRPIKGTRPRFPIDPVRDAESARELLTSTKERAELLMITDLERNDLGQICEFGSVTVPDLWRVESFAQVYHLVSTVTGHLRPGINHAQAFRACFPGGSITGAPKKRAREIIAELEPCPRGLYTGALGYFGFNGESQWNITIRTSVQEGDSIHFHAGSGIVADSIPEKEWEETQHKAAGILSAAS
jgi:para-aminobenzoate synthetase component 1